MNNKGSIIAISALVVLLSASIYIQLSSRFYSPVVVSDMVHARVAEFLCSKVESDAKSFSIQLSTGKPRITAVCSNGVTISVDINKPVTKDA